MIKIINTDKATYEEYVKQGLWIPQESVKYNIANSAKVQVNAKLKSKTVKYSLVTIIIKDYYYEMNRPKKQV